MRTQKIDGTWPFSSRELSGAHYRVVIVMMNSKSVLHGGFDAILVRTGSMSRKPSFSMRQRQIAQ
jgi:hypothetical protein